MTLFPSSLGGRGKHDSQDVMPHDQEETAAQYRYFVVPSEAENKTVLFPAVCWEVSTLQLPFLAA